MTTIEIKMYLNWQNKARKNPGSLPGQESDAIEGHSNIHSSFYFLET